MAASLYVSYAIPIPHSSVDGTTVSVPQFDSALGTLTGIRIAGFVEHILNLKAENTNVASTGTVAWGDGFEIESSFTLNTPLDVPMTESVLSLQPWTASLHAYDGVLDFAGASGRTEELNYSVRTDETVFTGAGGLTEMTGVGDASCKVHRLLSLDIGKTGEEADIATSYEHSIGAALLVVTYVYEAPA